jgi:hypothetical protein
MAWNAARRDVSGRPARRSSEEPTGRAIPILLELAEEVEHRLVEVVVDELEVAVRRERGDELDHGAPNERVPVVLVQEDLVADARVPVLHELPKKNLSV